MRKKIITVSLASCLAFSTVGPVLANQVTPANTVPGVQIKADQTSTNDIANLVNNQSATSLAAKIKSGELSPDQLLNYTFNKIERQNPNLNSVIYLNKNDAFQQLKTMQEHHQQNLPFYGVPLLIKGLGQPYKGWPNTKGVTFEKDDVAQRTSAFVKRLQSLGFVIIGQTNFPELGLINITNSILNGAAKNPWNTEHNTGGSSGGACASVAADFTPIATGNDAGGSLRIPASYCGVIGLKPTQGMIVGDPKTPSVVNFADTRSVADTQQLFNGMIADGMQKELKPVPTNLKSLTIAYSLKSPVHTPVTPAAQKAVLQAVDFLRAQGFHVVEQNAPVDGVKLMQAYFLGALSDGVFANKLAQQKLHRNLTPADINKTVSPMTYALYAASLKAPKDVDQQFNNEIKLIQTQMANFQKQYPIYLTPTTAMPAPLNSNPAYLPNEVAKLKNIDKLDFNDQMKLIYEAWSHGLAQTPFTQLANLSGDPAISLPTYVTAQGLPLGIQLQGGIGQDNTLLALAKLFEEKHQLHFLTEAPKTPLSTNQAASGTKTTNKAVNDNTTAENSPMSMNNDNHNNISKHTNDYDKKELPQTSEDINHFGLATFGVSLLVGLSAIAVFFKKRLL